MLLSNVIVYVIGSPTFTSVPLSGVDDLLGITFGLFTSSVTSSVGFPSTTAVFLIMYSNIPSGNSFTVTSNVTVTLVFPATFTVIPSPSNCSFVYVPSPFTFMLPSTSVVPSGTSSCTRTSFPICPSFLTVIVYFIFSPSTT